MSRSYKKTPRCGDKKDGFYKRLYNKRIRKLPFDETLQHKTYKRYQQAYDICDYQSVGDTFEQYWEGVVGRWYAWRHQYEPFPDRDEEYQKYMKWFKRK